MCYYLHQTLEYDPGLSPSDRALAEWGWAVAGCSFEDACQHIFSAIKNFGFRVNRLKQMRFVIWGMGIIFCRTPLGLASSSCPSAKPGGTITGRCRRLRRGAKLVQKAPPPDQFPSKRMALHPPPKETQPIQTWTTLTIRPP